MKEPKNYIDLKIDAAQNEVLKNCVAEAKKLHNTHVMKMHEISELHAKALFNVGDVKVYGFCSKGFVLLQTISDFTRFETYFID